MKSKEKSVLIRRARMNKMMKMKYFGSYLPEKEGLFL
jgi:hypothetical protein